MQGVSLSTVEFASKARTFSRSVLLSQSQHSDNQKGDSFVSVLEKTTVNEEDKAREEDRKIPASEKESPQEKSNQFESDRHVILFGKFSSTQEVRKQFL